MRQVLLNLVGSGEGIGPEAQARLFAPFSQVDPNSMFYNQLRGWAKLASANM